MTIRWMALVMSAGLLASTALAEEKPAPFRDQKAKESYSLGYQFGRNLTGQGVEIDKETLLNAISDAMDGKQPVISEYAIKETVTEMRRRVLSRQEQLIGEQAAKNLDDARAFLDENKKREGVITLPSGLQYRVVREGAGASPKEADGVRVRYRGSLVNGTEFDNVMDLADNDVPVIPVAGVNQGWTEALQLMKPGARWLLYVPPHLGYGDRPNGRIPANSVLVYELELLSVVDRSGMSPGAAAQAVSPAAAVKDRKKR